MGVATLLEEETVRGPVFYDPRRLVGRRGDPL